MILVTGASGYLGSQVLLGLLSGNVPLRALKRENSILPSSLTQPESGIEWVDSDLGDIMSLSEALKGVDQVIHCASARYDKDFQVAEIFRTNIDGTANLVNLCLDFKIRRFIYVSSSVTLGIKEGEDMEYVSLLNDFNDSRSPHVFAKIESEKEVWRGIMEGLPALVVNPGLILSEWSQSGNNIHLKSLYSQGSDYYFKRSFGIIGMEDFVETLLDLLNSDREGEQYLLSAENIQSADLIGHINQKLGLAKPRILYKNRVWKIPFLKENTVEIRNKSGIRELYRMVEGMIPLTPSLNHPLSGKPFKKLNELF